MANYPFRRLREDLEKLIRNMPPESRLPSEPELAQQLGVSRATLREAMRAFEAQGLIRRRQGLGTFVMPQVPVIESGLEVLESIDTLAHRIGLEVSMGALRVEQLPAEGEYLSALSVPAGTLLTRVERVIYHQARPIAYLMDAVPADILVPDDLSEGFTGSVLDLLLSRESLSLSHARTEINAVNALPEVARPLQIQRDDVLLLLREWLYATDGRVVAYSLSYFLPGYFRFHVISRPGKIG